MWNGSRCAVCPGINACLGPSGPLTRGGILFIGEAPGGEENKKGTVFIGKTGEEINRHYLPLAGLRRADVTFTNGIACLPDRPRGKLNPDRAQDIALLEGCAAHHLYPLIEELSPRLLVPLGAFACRAVFGEPYDLELRHGLPADTPFNVPAFPMYHPALGIHEPKKMLYIRTDWQRFGQYLHGTLQEPRDRFAGHEDYQEVTNARDFQDVDPALDLACDTEAKRGGTPHCLTYSQWAGAARLIRADRPDLLTAFSERLRQGTGAILFHSFLYDWTILESMALHVEPHRIVDTISLAFHLGNLPQGLKALAFRELGMVMEDFEDVVRPFSRQRVITYYEGAISETWPPPTGRLYLDEKSGLWKLKKPQGMSTKFKRFFTDLRKYGESKDVFQAWENWEDDQVMIEEQLGPWPGMCISHVPFERILFYACRDADALIRLWPLLRRMRARVRKTTQEHWREYGR